MNSVTVFGKLQVGSRTCLLKSISHCGGKSLWKRLTSCRTLLHYVTMTHPQATSRVTSPQATHGPSAPQWPHAAAPASELGLSDRMPACEARGATPQVMNSKAAASGEKQCGTHRPTLHSGRGAAQTLNTEPLAGSEFLNFGFLTPSPTEFEPEKDYHRSSSP